MGETVNIVKINIPLTITIYKKTFFTVWLNENSFLGNRLSDEIDAALTRSRCRRHNLVDIWKGYGFKERRDLFSSTRSHFHFTILKIYPTFVSLLCTKLHITLQHIALYVTNKDLRCALCSCFRTSFRDRKIQQRNNFYKTCEIKAEFVSIDVLV